MEIVTAILNSPPLSALIAVGGVILTLVVTNRQERNRLKATREERIQNERIAAYRQVLAGSANTPTKEDELSALILACSGTELLGGSSDLIANARHLRMAYLVVFVRREAHARDNIGQREVDSAIADWHQTRQTFLKLSREELELDPAVVPELPGSDRE